MKIILHALGANMGGAIRHLSNFIPALLKNNPGHSYVLIIRNDVELDFSSDDLDVIKVAAIISKSVLLRTLFDIIYLPLLAVIIKADRVVSLLNFGPILCSKKHINFQRNALFFCKYYQDNVKGLDKYYSKLRSVLLFLTMKFSDRIVTPSDSMTEMVKIRYPSLAHKRFITIYHGFNIPEREELNNDWLPILTTDKRLKILYPTHAASHKGFEILFEAISKLKSHIDHNNFVLYATIDESDWPAGVKRFRFQIEKLGIQKNVVFTGRIPQEQIAVFYKNCDLMVYPSLCESFGFSMVEAMGYGLPIVAADTSVNKEICKDAAIYYPAFDPVSAANKILECLNESVKEDLKYKSKERLKSFDWSWQRNASTFLDVVSNE